MYLASMPSFLGHPPGGSVGRETEGDGAMTEPARPRSARTSRGSYRRHEGADVVVVDPVWWVDHIDELFDALRQARPWGLAERTGSALANRPTSPPEGSIVITHPKWWVDHPDELEDALREAVHGAPAE